MRSDSRVAAITSLALQMFLDEIDAVQSQKSQPTPAAAPELVYRELAYEITRERIKGELPRTALGC